MEDNGRKWDGRFLIADFSRSHQVQPGHLYSHALDTATTSSHRIWAGQKKILAKISFLWQLHSTKATLCLAGHIPETIWQFSSMPTRPIQIRAQVWLITLRWTVSCMFWIKKKILGCERHESNHWTKPDEYDTVSRGLLLHEHLS